MSATRHVVTALRHGTSNGMDWEVEYEITFDYLPGAPDTFEEPGWGPEVGFVSIDEPGAGAAQKELEAWAADWLDEHLAELEEVVLRDREGDADYAADLKRENDERNEGTPSLPRRKGPD